MINREYPPEGSSIETEHTTAGIRYIWTNETSESNGINSAVGFLMLFMVGWAFGEISTIIELLNGQAEGSDRLFLMAWLGGWTLGGFWCAHTIYLSLRRPGPASLEIREREIKYSTGSRKLELSFRKLSRGENKAIFKGTKNTTYKMPLIQCSKVKLERDGEELRLSVDCKNKTIEIGNTLGEPDKEWLHKILIKSIE